MLKLGVKDFNEIRKWMYRNARHLELTLWQYEFENGRKDAVLGALSFYQNEDGGFGNALEPDSWNPDSTPYTTAIAIGILKVIGFTDVWHPIISGILRFLDSGVYFSEYGWDWSIPTNDDYPHAPWWNFTPNSAAAESGHTAELCSFILDVCEKDSALYKKALTLAKKLIEIQDMPEDYDHNGGGVQGICILVETLQSLNLLDKLDAKFSRETLNKMVANSMVTDSSKWHNDGLGLPSEYITTPGSMYYSGYQNLVQQELDFLIKTRPQQGVWNITWSWFENTEKYANEWAVAKNWWKGFHTIIKMRYLKNFNRLETGGYCESIYVRLRYRQR